MTDRWYLIENVDEIPSPALVVYPDRVRENLRRIIAMAGGVERLRPHMKTHKMAEVIRMQRAAGISKFKCATIAEAEMAAGAGAEDLLLAYPPIGPNAARLCRLAKGFPATKFSTIADDAGAIRALSQACSLSGVSLDVLLDVDNGMHRSGIAPGDEAIALYRMLADSPGLAPGGFHVYDGHVREADLAERTRHSDADFVPVEAMRQKLLAAGLPVPRIVAGGTPTFPIHAQHADRECSPGTCVFWDVSYAGKFPDLEFVNAALVLTRVISKPGGNRLCLDLGYKAISADNPDPRVQLLDAADAKMVVHSEEHLAVETKRANEFAVGDALYGVPFHVCPTVALHREAVVVENGRAVGRWTVAARDRMLTI